jgi:hypothetical protein
MSSLAAALEARAKATPRPWYEQTDCNQGTGIRAKSGFVFFTPVIIHYPRQDKRYEQELAERDANVKAAIAAPDALDWIAEAAEVMKIRHTELSEHKKRIESYWSLNEFEAWRDELACLEALLARVGR